MSNGSGDWGLECRVLTASYGPRQVVKRVSLQVSRGRTTCLVGPSGSGKSTLLRCVAGFEKPHSGSILIEGQLVSGPGVFVPPEHRQVGFVFQNFALFPHLTVAENVAFGLGRAVRRAARRLEAKDRSRVAEVLESVDMLEYRHRYPHELSGGQQQRIALARALAPRPNLILLDEPFSNLDPHLRDRLKREIRTLLRALEVTAVMVTHDQNEAFDIADDLGVLVDGELAQWGHPYDLYHRPTNRVVAEFLGASAFIPAILKPNGLVTTELGDLTDQDLKAEDLASLHRGERLELLLRPDDLVHDDTVTPICEVINVAFRGIYRIYDLRLPSGRLVQCFTSSHHELHPVGTFLGARLDVRHTILVKASVPLTMHQAASSPHHAHL